MRCANLIYFLLPVSIFITASDNPKNALDYIPPDNFIGGWEANGDPIFVKPEKAGHFVSEPVEILKEFNAVWFASQLYSNYDSEMTIEIYEFATQSDAYGFYQIAPILNTAPPLSEGIKFKPYAPPPKCEIDTIRFIANRYLEAFKGRFYFRVKSDPEKGLAPLIDIGLYMLASLPGSSVQADMLSYLPLKNLVRGSERYIKGPAALNLLLGLTDEDIFKIKENDACAVAGEYRLGGGEYYLLVIFKYKDFETTSSVADSLQKYFQEKKWKTEIIPPIKKGLNPRAFSNKTYIAFWPNNDLIYFIWDTSNREQLLKALKQFSQ